MCYMGTSGSYIMMAIGGCMRWGLYEKYLAQNKITTVKVYFVLDELSIQISIPIGC